MMAPRSRARLAAALLFGGLLFALSSVRARSRAADRRARRQLPKERGIWRAAIGVAPEAKPDLWGRGKDLANPGFVGERCHWLDGGFPRCERCAGGGRACAELPRRGRCPKFRRSTNERAVALDVSRDPPALRLTWADADVAHFRAACLGGLRAPCFNVSRCGLARDAPVRVYVYPGSRNEFGAPLAPLVDAAARASGGAIAVARAPDARACVLVAGAGAFARAADVGADAAAWRDGAHHVLWQPNEWDRDAFGAHPDRPFCTRFDAGLAMIAQAVHVRASFRPRFDLMLALAPRLIVEPGKHLINARLLDPAAAPPASAARAAAPEGGAPRKYLLTFRGQVLDLPNSWWQHRWVAAEHWHDPARGVVIDAKCSRGRRDPGEYEQRALPARARGHRGGGSGRAGRGSERVGSAPEWILCLMLARRAVC